MREKSQIEDMRAALRGDIERARARRDADPWRSPEPERPVAAETPTAPQELTPEGSVPEENASEPEVEPEVVPEQEPEPEPEPVAEAPDAAGEVQSSPQPPAEEAVQAERPGFFGRLFGRR